MKQAETKRNDTRHNRNETKRDTTETKRKKTNHQTKQTLTKRFFFYMRQQSTKCQWWIEKPFKFTGRFGHGRK